jgi:pilus assembly protein CpaF
MTSEWSRHTHRDPVEQVVREIVLGELKQLLQTYRDDTPMERAARIRTMVKDEVTEYQRRAVATNQPLLEDPAAAEERLIDELLGMGPLESLMRQQDVQTIRVLSPTRVYVVRGGRQERVHGVRFGSDRQVRELVKRMAAAAGRLFDEAHPRVDFALPDGSRMHAVMPPVSSQYTEVTIRRFTLHDRRLESLVPETMPADLVSFVSSCVKARANIVIAGDSGVGKTTVQRMAALEIDDPDDWVIVIEPTRELGLHLLLGQCQSWEARPDNSEGLGRITQAQLLEDDALRCEPTRIIVGECRGPEAWTFLLAVNSGHSGSMTTIHARSAHNALDRLMVAALQEPGAAAVGHDVIRDIIADNIDLVVYLEKRQGRRRVTQVIEVDPSTDGGVFHTRALWELQDDELKRTALRPALLDRIARAGIALPPGLAA